MIVSNHSTLIAPYGGKLVDLTVPVEAFDGLKAYASQLPSIHISPRTVCDLELLATGALSPLDRFMGREDFQRVLDEMRLGNGKVFPIPVTFPVEASADIRLDRDIALRNNENELLAVMTIEEIYEWDRIEFASKVFETAALRHPLEAVLQGWGSLNISGRLHILHLPGHLDFQDLRLAPSQTRARLAEMGRRNVVAYQPHTALPRVDEEMLAKAVEDVDGTLLLQLAVGLARLGDVDHYTRTRIFNALVERYPKQDRVLFSLLPLASWMAGHREVLWQALISRNYGANHMMVNRNDAGSGIFSARRNGHNSQAIQDLVVKYSQELGVKLVPEPEQIEDFASIHPEVAGILAETYPPRHRQGVCIWFTGLSGSGKSSTAEMLTWLLMEHGRRVTVLDGDVVRTHLSKGLGFSKEDRDTNVRRIGFVASELVRMGGVVICAVVSPYRAARNDVRDMVGDDQFVEVFVNAPLEICETRDVKGMYARARKGGLNGFTGIDDPYERPHDPEITLDTVDHTLQENANFIIEYLIEQGFLRARKQNEGYF